MSSYTLNRCPECGYTKEDALIHWDHHLCNGKIPGYDPDIPEKEAKPAQLPKEPVSGSDELLKKLENSYEELKTKDSIKETEYQNGRRHGVYIALQIARMHFDPEDNRV